MNNVFKTTLLLTALTGLFLVIGNALGGQQGMIMAFIFAVGMNFFAYWFSDKIVLKMYRASEVGPAEAPQLHAMIDRLCARANLPKPKVYIIPDMQPNAFATGRNPQNAAVAATEGIMRILSMDELEGVMAHELAHVKHRDILISTIAATIAGAVMMLANIARFGMIFGGYGRSDDREGANPIVMLVSIIVAPLAAMIIQMWISRTREYMADAGGAEMCGNPLALANALRKLESGAHQIPMDANPATSHMFIVNPLSGQQVMSLFSTHPPMGERIARLEAMARSPRSGEPQGDVTFRRYL
jgi:heat shock protein HtpX